MWSRREKTCQRQEEMSFFFHNAIFYFQYCNILFILTSWFESFFLFFLPFWSTSTVSQKPCLHCHDIVMVLSHSFELCKTHSWGIAEQALVSGKSCNIPSWIPASVSTISSKSFGDYLLSADSFKGNKQWSGRGRHEIKFDKHAHAFLYRRFSVNLQDISGY